MLLNASSRYVAIEFLILCRVASVSALQSRALITRPRLVLADEPTGNLDAGNGEQILDLMLELNRELRTSRVIVTPDYSIAARMDRVLTLDGGRLRLTT